jgi:hypothetical protein
VALAAAALVPLWIVVLWSIFSQPALRPDVTEPAEPAPMAQAFVIRRVAASGQEAPGGGVFDRFHVELQPIIAPVNAHGQVAFFATLARGPAAEGVFLFADGRLRRLAAAGDAVPGGGSISGFGKHPIPAINGNGKVAFAAALSGGRSTEGIVLHDGKPRLVVTTGTAAPGIAAGTLAELDAPALNDRDEIIFLAQVRRGRETVPAIFRASGGKIEKVVAAGDPAPGGGSFTGFGVPTLNNAGAIAFPAVVEQGAVLGGVYRAEGGAIRQLVGAGEAAPGGGMITKLSERVALDEQGRVAFSAVVRGGKVPLMLLRAGTGAPEALVSVGESAPDGGQFSFFSLWPAVDAGEGIAFVASVDGSSGPIAVFIMRGGSGQRVVAVGDTLADGNRVVSLGLYPAVAASPNGRLTFATMSSAEGGVDAVYLAEPGGR